MYYALLKVGFVHQIGSYFIPGFRIYRQDRDFSKSKSSGGGLLTYVRENLISDDKIYSHLNVNERELECYFIKIRKKESKDIMSITKVILKITNKFS